ncbi:MAG TPA: acyl-CoA dehydrogenase family protein [Candidatus Limnocylindria bacterium]|nr:acyl-CoA dehydrogenase family protein [Candidatus Limnocylindria bacterium]
MTITASAPTTNSTTPWVARAEELSADFATRAAEHDANDTFVAENYAKMREAKLFSAPVPSELGGGGASYADHCAIIRALGRGCGSTALAYSMHSHLLQALIWRHRHGATPPAEPLLRRIANDELVLISSGGSDWLDSSGTLVKENGSYTFSGRKIFSSGSPSGDVLLTTGVYDDPEKGPTVLHFGVDLHGPGVKILDNWRTFGMRGTGSNDILIEGVRIQDAAVSVRRPKGKWHQFFNVVVPIIFPLIVSAYVGVAESARDIAVKQAAKRRDDAIAQSLIGEMDTELLIARETLADMVALGGSDYTPDLANADLTFKRKTIAARAVVRVAHLAMEAAGGGSFFRAVGLERSVRDIQAVRFHPLHEARQYQFSGRVALGLDPV